MTQSCLLQFAFALLSPQYRYYRFAIIVICGSIFLKNVKILKPVHNSWYKGSRNKNLWSNRSRDKHHHRFLDLRSLEIEHLCIMIL